MNGGGVFDAKFCLELIIALAAVAGMWLRLEHRLTKIEGRVQERYRDKKATEERIEKVERWLPGNEKQP